MPQMSVDQVVAKWSRNLQAAQQTIKDGVTATTKNPMALAAARSEAYVSGVQAAVSNGTWQAGLLAVNPQTWKDNTINVGLPRLAAGVKKAETKQTQFFTQLLPYTTALSQQVAQMPKNGLQDSIARATFAIQQMAAFKFRKRA